MNNKQTARIVGHLGNDCRLHNSGTGDFLSFSVAVTHKYTDRQGLKQEYTQWHSCTTRQTNLEKYLTKSTQVMVEGPFEAIIYQTKEGHNRIDCRMSVNNLVLLGSANREAGQNQQPASDGLTPGPVAASDEDDLPF